MDSWHAVRTRTGYELRVANGARNLGLESYCPEFLASWVVRGRRCERWFPYLATYAFARWNARNAAVWHAIQELKGFSYHLGGEEPDPISEREMDVLRAQIGTDGTLLQNARESRETFELGEPVRIIAGPFEGRTGKITTIAATVLQLEIGGVLSRDVTIYIPPSLVEKLEQTSSPAESAVATRGTGNLRSWKRRDRKRKLYAAHVT